MGHKSSSDWFSSECHPVVGLLKVSSREQLRQDFAIRNLIYREAGRAASRIEVERYPGK